MSTSIDIGTAEVKLIDLGQVNNEPTVNKIYSKSTIDWTWISVCTNTSKKYKYILNKH